MTLKEEYEKKKKRYIRDANECLRYTRLDGAWELYIGGDVEGDCFRRDVWEDTMREYVNENIKEINQRAYGKIIGMIGE